MVVKYIKNINIITDLNSFKVACRSTTGFKEIKNPISLFEKLLIGRHSPIRTVLIEVEMTIPYYVSVHFCRHKIGVEHFVQTQDKNKERSEIPQTALVNHYMVLNAEAILNILEKRLCKKSWGVTTDVSKEIKQFCEMSDNEILNILAKNMKKPCERYKSCPEPTPCYSKPKTHEFQLSNAGLKLYENLMKKIIIEGPDGNKLSISNTCIEYKNEKLVDINDIYGAFSEVLFTERRNKMISELKFLINNADRENIRRFDPDTVEAIERLELLLKEN